MMGDIKFRDFIGTDVDIDTYNDITDEDGMAFVGPVALTEAGEKEFGCLLDLNVRVSTGNVAVVEMPTGPESQTYKCLRAFGSFLRCAAGYCPQSTYDRFFKKLSSDELYNCKDIEEVLQDAANV